MYFDNRLQPALAAVEDKVSYIRRAAVFGGREVYD
jgi:hypothetical protein